MHSGDVVFDVTSQAERLDGQAFEWGRRGCVAQGVLGTGGRLDQALNQMGVLSGVFDVADGLGELGVKCKGQQQACEGDECAFQGCFSWWMS
jgi:hypothetical protein